MGPGMGPADACLLIACGKDSAKGVMEMAKLMEKGSTIAKDYIGGQIRKLGEVSKSSIIPRPDKDPHYPFGQLLWWGSCLDVV